MKSFFKKFTALFLSAMLVFSILPVSAFAYDTSDRADAALEFIRSKGIIVGEVLSVNDDDDDEIIFTVSYLPSGENSQIKYLEENNDILVTIIENHAQDEILFKSNGLTYLDGELTDIYDEQPSMYASYATGYLETVPPGCANNNWGTPIYSGENVLSLGALSVASYTANSLATKLAVALTIPAQYHAIFLIVAGGVIDYAIDTGLEIFNISWTRSSWEDDTLAPLQYFYKYERHFSAFNWSGNKTYYATKNLL